MMKAPDRDKRKGILACYTGEGKGKTTAAFGTILRAVGYGWKICVIQYVKGSWKYGEMEGIKQLEPKVEFHRKGLGFYKIVDDKLPEEEHKNAAAEALEFSREKITSNDFDMVILDEFNVAIQTGLIAVDDAIDLLKQRPPWLHLIVTGRGAPDELIEICDLVTEMKEIKHPYQSGTLAQKGFDY